MNIHQIINNHAIYFLNDIIYSRIVICSISRSIAKSLINIISPLTLF